MNLERQKDVIETISAAMEAAEIGDRQEAANELDETLYKLTQSVGGRSLALDAANSLTLVCWLERMADADEILEIVVRYVALDVPADIWRRWFDRHTIDSELAHFCPDMEVLRALSGTHWEAAANYAARLYLEDRYSPKEFDGFLALWRDNPLQTKRIVLALCVMTPHSSEKKAIHARYLASIPVTSKRGPRRNR